MKNTKISYLKRMVGKKVFVIKDIQRCEGYIGYINDVKNEDSFIITNDNSESNIVNIFDVRSMPYEW